jgi:hypothetical protein
MQIPRAVVVTAGFLILVGVVAFVWRNQEGLPEHTDVSMQPAQHVAVEGGTSPHRASNDPRPDRLAATRSAETESSRGVLPPTPAATLNRSKREASGSHLVPAATALTDWLTADGDRVMGNPLAAPHQELQSEKSDPQWSPGATQTLTNRLGDDFGGELEFPSIDCRTDMCEVQAATLSANQSDVMMDFQQSIYRMPQEEWWKQSGFGAPTFAVKGLPDGRDIIVVFISRTP